MERVENDGENHHKQQQTQDAYADEKRKEERALAHGLRSRLGAQPIPATTSSAYSRAIEPGIVALDPPAQGLDVPLKAAAGWAWHVGEAWWRWGMRAACLIESRRGSRPAKHADLQHRAIAA